MISRWPMMELAARLLKPFWPVVLAATAMGVVSGLATMLLLATINGALHGAEETTATIVLSFVGLCALMIAGEVVSDLGNSYVGQQAVAALRTDITNTILSASVEELEQLKPHKLAATFNQDVETISNFTFTFSSLAIAAAVIIAGFAYLTTLSPPLTLIAGATIAAGTLMHTAALRKANGVFEVSRGQHETLHKYFRAITEGAKELKLNRDRRVQIHSGDLAGAIGGIRDFRIRAMRILMSANAFGSALFLIVIGLLLAMRGWLSLSGEVMSAFVLVLLVLRGPLQQLVAALPLMAQARIAIARIAELSHAFETRDVDLEARHATQSSIPETIELREVSYSFSTLSRQRPFQLGPVNLTIRHGEIVFLVGENGSGKTTLIKILLGLYQPHTGMVLADGEPVTAGSRDDYRQLFTTVFADYHLFDDLIRACALSEDAAALLQKLDLAGKVEVRDGRFTTTDLSTGQRKRLALVHAYLERRPVMVFDEWAADQDPGFRRIFYRELLPDLKSQGKTIIVISHDDRFFHVADRIVHLADGKVVRIETPISTEVTELEPAR